MNSIDQHTIDEYLLNRLEGEDLKAFEQLLAKDETLATAVGAQKQAIAALSFVGDIQMKERVKRIHQTELARAGKQVSSNKRWKLAAALLFLLVVAIGTWLILRPKPQTPTQLYAAYYKPYDLSFGSRDTEASQMLAEAGNSYKAGKFAEALPLFEKALVAVPNDSKARLAAGICHLELGRNDQALAQFNSLIEANDPLFGEHAHWYAAMTRLRQGNVSEAKALLEKLIAENPAGAMAVDARQMLEALED